MRMGAVLAAAACASLVACGSSGGSDGGGGTTTSTAGTATVTASATATASATGTAAPASTSTVSTPSSGLAGSACTKLKSLRDLDYAFGKSFTSIQPLAASGKQQTLADLQRFASEAPAELTGATSTLVGFWQKFAADAYSVDQAAYDAAGKPFVDYLAANCG